ncbi:MAG: hypothetical protein JJU40_11420 [Rhodobacteraceae bacterium]|nr:hypothetical protein [Paracoccaceae bacterium]
MIRIVMLVILAAVVSACGSNRDVAAEATVLAASWRDPSPASLTLVTVVNTRSGDGAHSALIVNGSQRVIFDPAGTWWHRSAPQRGDVLYGMTPQLLDFYLDYHTRETHYTVLSELRVSPELAEQALTLVRGHGAVQNAMCAVAVSGVLRRLPGFESIGSTWFPNRLREDFAALPGVTERVLRDDSPADNRALLARQQQQSLLR